MNKIFLCCALAGLMIGVASATETPRVAAPNPVVMPDTPPQSVAVPAQTLGNAPAPASKKVREAYAAQKAAKSQGRKAADMNQAKKVQAGKQASKKAGKGRKTVKKAGAKRKARAS